MRPLCVLSCSEGLALAVADPSCTRAGRAHTPLPTPAPLPSAGTGAVHAQFLPAPHCPIPIVVHTSLCQPIRTTQGGVDTAGGGCSAGPGGVVRALYHVASTWTGPLLGRLLIPRNPCLLQDREHPNDCRPREGKAMHGPSPGHWGTQALESSVRTGEDLGFLCWPREPHSLRSLGRAAHAWP